MEGNKTPTLERKETNLNHLVTSGSENYSASWCLYIIYGPVF